MTPSVRWYALGLNLVIWCFKYRSDNSANVSSPAGVMPMTRDFSTFATICALSCRASDSVEAFNFFILRRPDWSE
jgi:hypothetical protein